MPKLPTKKKPDSHPVSKKDIQEVFKRLSAEFPDPKTELTYKNPYELLVAVILSAQCTDARVNLTTHALFAKYPSPHSLASAKQSDVEKLIHSCGFYRNKAKNIIACCQSLIDKHGAEVPGTLEDLVALEGVGRKTASVVLNQAFNVPAIAVDTHVNRVANRLGWAKSPNPEKIERQLRELLPQALWAEVNGLLILHGRKTCKARKPNCPDCSLSAYCEYASQSESINPDSA